VTLLRLTGDFSDIKERYSVAKHSAEILELPLNLYIAEYLPFNA